jgi:hypothetical protein
MVCFLPFFLLLFFHPFHLRLLCTLRSRSLSPTTLSVTSS